MGNNTYGLDFGTYDLKIYDQKKNSTWKVKNAIAVKENQRVYAAGDAAYAMHEKTPDFIKVSFPMKSGVIANFDLMQKLMQILFSQEGHKVGAGSYLIAMSPDMTEVEKSAFVQLMGYSKMKVHSANIVERGIAAAIGMDVSILDEKGLFLVDLGGESCEFSVISQGGVVLNRRLKTGGIQMDLAIINKIRHQQDFLIGQATAEHIRKHFGLSNSTQKEEIMVAGRDLCSGLPKMKQISADTVRDALDDFFKNYIIAIESMLRRIPPDVRRQVERTGIFLCGGIANMEGIGFYFEEKLKCKIVIPDQPELCVVKGLKEMIDNPKYKKLTYSMADENYRWLR